MWSQWYFSLSIWQVHLGLLENIKMYYVTKSYKKMQTLSWNICVNVRERICLCSIQYVWILSLNVLLKKKKQLFWCYDLPTLHWVSSTPHSANRRWTKVRRGDGDNSCVHVYSRTFKNVLFFFILSVKFTYLIVAFIVEYSSRIIIQYCTILFQLLTKEKKKVKK